MPVAINERLEARLLENFLLVTLSVTFRRLSGAVE
jgi:hypothetical protein